MPRFLFYSHDGLGLGHTRRNLSIAAALNELAPDCAIILATGIDDINQFGVPSGVDVLKLPGLRKISNENYSSRKLRVSREEILAIRSDLLRSVVGTFRPDVVIVDKHPFGAAGELLPALRFHRERGGRAVLGLRDILDSADTVRREWMNLPEPLADYFEEIFIYGMESIFDAVREYEFPEDLAARSRYCGYVLNRTRKEYRATDSPEPFLQDRGEPVVLATPGGGEDGFELLQNFIAASRGAPWRGVIVTGPLHSGGRQNILRQAAAEAGVGFRSFVPGLQNWFSAVDAVVSMAGYNTVTEIVFAGTPSVCVPRTEPRTEQLLRATAFERLGLLRCLDPLDISPERLAEAIREALAGDRRRFESARQAIDFGGAAAAAAALVRLAGREGTTSSVLETAAD